jgi:hypothetical protein
MGRSLNELKSHVSDEDVVLVTIITDGYENASREYSGHDIKSLVAELKAKGWVFAYIGTNQDVDAVADDMGIRSRMCYDYSDLGAQEMFNTEHNRRKKFYGRLAQEGTCFMRKGSYDYFESGNQDEEEKPEKAPDITWDVKDDTSSPAVDSSDNDKQEEEDPNQQENTQSDVTTEEPEEPKGFWDKVKNILKG